MQRETIQEADHEDFTGCAMELGLFSVGIGNH